MAQCKKELETKKGTIFYCVLEAGHTAAHEFMVEQQEPPSR